MVWFTADVFIEYRALADNIGTSAEELGLSDYRILLFIPVSIRR